PLQEQPGVVVRHHAGRPGQPEERDGDLERLRPVGRGAVLDGRDGAGREAQRRRRAEADGLLLRRRVGADGGAAQFAGDEPEQADGLEKVEAPGRAEQLAGQASTRSPVRGGQRHSAPSRCRVTATNLVNEFTVKYRPKKRSRTAANRYSPPPVKASSSNCTVTSTPRQMPPSVALPTRPATRR